MHSLSEGLEKHIFLQTDDWLVLNKPAGQSIHHESEQGLILKLKQEISFEFLAPVHRLDKVTSGCLLLAKNHEAAAYLSKQFQNQTVEKIYLAITQGKPKKKQGRIIGDMAPGRVGNWRLKHSKLNPAITDYYSYGYQDGFRIAIVKPITGKTHQIRVALKSNSCPILGDQRYATNSDLTTLVDRCYLHCWQLKFTDINEKQITVAAKPESGDLFMKDRFWQIVNSKFESISWRT